MDPPRVPVRRAGAAAGLYKFVGGRGAVTRGFEGAPTGGNYLKHLFARGAFLCEKIKNGLDTEYYRQALEYWTIVRRFVCNMLDAYYPSEADKNVFVNDHETQGFLVQVINSIQATSDMLESGNQKVALAWEALGKTEQYEVVIDAIANCIDTVSAGHEQVRGSSSSPAPVAATPSASPPRTGMVPSHRLAKSARTPKTPPSRPGLGQSLCGTRA